MKKILSGLLTVCLLVSMLAVADTPIKAEAASTSGSLEQRITQLQKKFPNGKYWNHSGSFVNNPDGWTDTPCTHHGNCLAKGYQGQCGCNSFSNAIQCMGFSEKLGYDVFGSAPRTWSSHTNLSKVKAGDVIRYRYNTHSVFVTKVTANTITFADCNWDGHCKIRWNVTIPKSSITGLTYIRHANNYDSVVKIPQTVKLTTAKNKATKKVWLKWNRSDKTSGYEVYRSTKKNSGYKKIKTINSAKNCSMTDKNRMIGKKYYYKIRAYRNVNGQRLYGSYSNIKSITIRK